MAFPLPMRILIASCSAIALLAAFTAPAGSALF